MGNLIVIPGNFCSKSEEQVFAGIGLKHNFTAILSISSQRRTSAKLSCIHLKKRPFAYNVQLPQILKLQAKMRHHFIAQPFSSIAPVVLLVDFKIVAVQN